MTRTLLDEEAYEFLTLFEVEGVDTCSNAPGERVNLCRQPVADGEFLVLRLECVSLLLELSMAAGPATHRPEVRGDQEATEGFICIAVQLAGRLLAVGQHAARMSVAETQRYAGLDAERCEGRPCLAAPV